jgi:rod shape-determining protein MreD
MGGCTIRLEGYPLLPAFFLIPVYYWLVFSPNWLPLWSLFGIGLFYDALIGYELGFSSFLLMLSAFLAQYIRPLLSSYQFPLIWGAFAIYSLGYLVCYGIFFPSYFPLAVSWMYGIILYPLVTWVLSHLHLRIQYYG